MSVPLTPEAADCLIFDWDGTLVDTQPANYRAMSGALAAYDIDMPEPWFAARTGVSSAEMIELFVREHGLTLPVPVAEVVGDRDARYLAQVDSVAEHPHVANIARQYRGRVPLAVATGGSRTIIEATMRVTGLGSLFDVLVTREDVQAGKPAPDLFLLAADRLGIAPSNCLVFEDSDEGMLAAQRAGMGAIDVRGTLS
jgi:beta-phosphoglucomutase-like phosphatase (HAD superfamily)